jgi:hypothetical protein
MYWVPLLLLVRLGKFLLRDSFEGRREGYRKTWQSSLYFEGRREGYRKTWQSSVYKCIKAWPLLQGLSFGAMFCSHPVKAIGEVLRL